ncbi:MAG: CPBP family intramembrane metalloprotease [Labilithrix sp.]|nr:CPBP family intramembrane metalloprotease [Labilithrix sp.]
MDSTPPEAQERPLSFLAAAFWTLIVGILYYATVVVVDAARPGALTDVVSRTTCTVLVYSICFFALLRVHEPEASIRQVLALRRPPVALLLLGAAVGAGMAPGAMWLNATFLARFPPPASEVEAVATLLAAPTLAKKIALVVTLVIVAPACDELFFRGALFTPLKRGRRAESVILATAAYDTLLGASPHEIGSMLAVSLAFAWLRAVSGSVFPSLVARTAFFAVQVVPLVIDREPKYTHAVALGGAALAMLSLAAASAIGKRSARVLEARLQDG